MDITSKSSILKLQETIESILKHKNYTEIFKVLIFLLRKYLPQDFNIQMEKGKINVIRYIYNIYVYVYIKFSRFQAQIK